MILHAMSIILMALKMGEADWGPLMLYGIPSILAPDSYDQLLI